MKIIYKIVFAQLLVALISFEAFSQELNVSVKNSSMLKRVSETVEVPFSAIKGEFQRAMDRIVVCDKAGKHLPSQLTSTGLLFQATVLPKSSEQYTLKLAQQSDEYAQHAFGRLVPERFDDWSWENNRIAFRVYGPALQATGEISNGMDVWLKSTTELVINKWYKNGINYHEDTGEGLDCYKVGRTLGAGAMAPVVDGKFNLGENFVKAELIDSGAIRTTVHLTYAPQTVGDFIINEERIISLDANTNFNKITQIYKGDFDKLDVAAGIVLRKGGKIEQTAQSVAYIEPTDPKNGTTYVAVIMNNKCVCEKIDGHITMRSSMKSGNPLTYLSGAGWSKAGFPKADDWVKAVEEQTIRLNNPLKVIVK
ncbi:MAG: DUF4861 family protein [Rikenellaceae bacterium]